MITYFTGRRALLQSAAVALGGAMLPGIASTASSQAQAAKSYEFLVKDLVYSHSGGKDRLARLYQPAGTGPFPAVVQIHGGSWVGNDRTDGQNISLDFVEAGIVVLAIEFRSSLEAPYPAALQDINYGIRWLKAHAPEFGSSADRVGILGTSSGGLLAVLAAMRPDDPRYRAQQLADAPDMDAKLAFMISAWGVSFPLARYNIAKAKGDQDMVKNHDRFFGSEATMIEATPALAIERSEKLYLPPALVFQGTKDEWTPVELVRRFADDYRKAGGAIDLELYEGEHHTFLNTAPFAPNSDKARQAMLDFIKKYGTAKLLNCAALVRPTSVPQTPR
jgi:acetyl esterase